jgi:hypothetical protein
MAKSFLDLMEHKSTNETQHTLNLCIKRKPHNAVKVQNTKVKEMISKAIRNRRHIACKVTTCRLTTAPQEQGSAFKMLKGKNKNNF